MACYRRALEIDPRDAQAHNNLGHALAQQGKVEEAIASYRRAIQADRGHAQAHCNLGLLLSRQGRFQEALAALEWGHALGDKQRDWRLPSDRWVSDCRRQVDLDARLPDLLAGK